MTEAVVKGTNLKKIVNGLLEKQVLTEETLAEVVNKAQKTKKNVGEILIEDGYISKEALAKFIEKLFELPRVDLTSYVPDPEALKLVPKTVVHKYLILPLFEIEGALTVAISDPLTIFIFDSISEEIGYELDPVLTTEESLLDSIIVYYGISSDEMSGYHKSQYSFSGIESEFEVKEEDLFSIDLDRLAILEDSSVSELLTEILLKAKKAEASTVHIEPLESDFRIMFRVEGALKTVGVAARSLQKPLTDYLKNVSKFPRHIDRPLEKILELPRIGEMIISMFPTIHGERIVLTFERNPSKIEDIEQIGLSKAELDKIKKVLETRHGLIAIGAPISSGKTSTLRTFLKYANRDGRSAFMLAVEEVRPVKGVQFQKLRGEEFLSAVEGLIHQDIDVVGLDEAGSPEVIRACIRLAEKSLVILTLEASNITETIGRMIDLGAEMFSLSWVLNAVISQRVMKKNCMHCLEEYKSPLITNKVVKKYLGDNPVVYRSKGCEACKYTGTDGYVSVFELTTFSESMKRKLAASFNPVDFQNQLRSKGVNSILSRAMEKVNEKLVTLEEVYRVAGFKE